MKSHVTSVLSASPCAMTALEPRRLFAVDLIASATAEAGFYGPSDLITFHITLTNQGTTAAGDGVVALPHCTLVLTKDKIIGNADDIPDIHTTVVPTLAAGASTVEDIATTFDESKAAGDYYIATVADNFGFISESDESNNVFISPTPSIRLVRGELASNTVLGTAGNDVITLEAHGSNTILTLDGVSSIVPSAFDHLFIDGDLGNDRIFVTNNQVFLRMQVTGGAGNDIIIGGNVADELSGGLGRDKLWGGNGDDFLIGGAENDYLTGENGNDLLLGAGGNDRLADVFGKDWFIGGNGNDVIICRDVTSNNINDPDTVSGNAGFDRAQIDTGAFADPTTNVEELIP